MDTAYDAVALYSGGLDSILAIKTVEEQGLRVKCLHCVSPFFGKPALVPHWRKIYGLDIAVLDVSEAFVRMLAARPAYGFGKVLNPCVDCKVLMMEQARAQMPRYGASFIISGEVLGQRPMSQRRDTLNVIRRDGDVRDTLLRPLSAQLLEPTPMEISGLVDRGRLHDIAGRGRKKQMLLAEHFGLSEIPTPAGGCRLAERENARRYWPVLCRAPRLTAAEFHLADTGRQYWAGEHWLSVGRNSRDNDLLLQRAFPEDAVFDVQDCPGPLAVGRQFTDWEPAVLRDAAAFMASFAPKAAARQITVRVTRGSLRGEVLCECAVRPERSTPLEWNMPPWPEVREKIREEFRPAPLPPQG